MRFGDLVNAAHRDPIEARYGQDPVLPAAAIGPKMARLRREHHRMLGNGWCTRPRSWTARSNPSAGSAPSSRPASSSGPPCKAQRDDAIARHQDHREQLFASLLTRL
jgi:hypothetical protein